MRGGGGGGYGSRPHVDVRAPKVEPRARGQLAHDIAMRDARAPTSPSSQGVIPTSQQISNVRGAGGFRGWQAEVPLSNPPGTNYADRLMDEADRRDRLQLMAEDAQRRALMKAAQPK